MTMQCPVPHVFAVWSLDDPWPAVVRAVDTVKVTARTLR